MKPNRFFLDTAYVLALLNPNDIYHKQAKTLFNSMHSAREVWITEAALTTDEHFQQAGFRALLLN